MNKLLKLFALVYISSKVEPVILGATDYSPIR